jgi:DNA-3-methyladenine glycosylase II
MPNMPSTGPAESLTEAALAASARTLARREARFRHVLLRYGLPPLWAREPGFDTLLYIILEQQVSLASARAAYNRLCEVASPLTPERFLALSDAQLRGIGFSRQKTRYGRALARLIADGALDLQTLSDMPDNEVRTTLIRVPGIGSWTVDVYLLMALLRPDAFPEGDLALLVAAQRLFELPARPAANALKEMAEAWRPHRATAARLLWQFYLNAY